MNDALTYSHVVKELQVLRSGRIDKINMPNNYDVVFTIKQGRLVFNLLISCNPSYARMHLIKNKPENPATPYAFLMNLRKYLLGGAILSIEQIPNERVIKIQIKSTTQLFYEEIYTLYAEIMGKYSNVILVNCEGKITESAIHVTAYTSSKRMILPGMPYALPPYQEGKHEITNEEDFVNIVLSYDKSKALHNFLVEKFIGFAPLTLKQAVIESGFDGEINLEKAKKLYNSIISIKNKYQPCIEIKDNVAVGFYPFVYHELKTVEVVDSLSDAMNKYYAHTFSMKSSNEKEKQLESLIKSAISKNKKKIESLNLKIIENSDNEKYRIFGELITANIYRIKFGDSKTTVYDYYSNQDVDIILDPLISPAQNAQKYYKKYSKAKKTVSMSEELVVKYEEKIEYYESLLVALYHCNGISDYVEIEREMKECGLIYDKKNVKLKTSTGPRKFTVDGYTVLIGKNNLQNDELVKKSDGANVWLHTQKIHGSHTVIVGKEVPFSTIEKVASFCAFYSKASMSDNVPVDYTLIKYVKKPAGAMAGKVIYTNQQTVYVTPKNPEIDK